MLVNMINSGRLLFFYLAIYMQVFGMAFWGFLIGGEVVI